MDKTYADTVRLLLAVAPDVFANDIFAMKGGTAINLFVRDMPRLSVDIDVVYLPWQTPRDEALQAINQELAAIAARVAPLGVQTRLVRAKDLGDTKLIVENDASQVKIEVNVVFRGSVLPVERRPLSAKTSDLFGVEFELPVLAPDELYASKLVAALDRQHPRDLFDVWQLYESGDISDGMVECFVIYLAGHNRPPHEVLFGNDKDIAGEYERAFVGMTEVDCSLETLLDARARLRRELPQRLSTAHKQFLSGLARAEPDWSLVRCQAGPADGWLTQDALWLVSKTVSDKLRAHLLSQGIDGIPASNTAVFNVLQDHGIVQPTPDGKAIWKAAVTSEAGWSHAFTFLKLSPAMIWDAADRPAPFAGRVQVEEEQAEPTPQAPAVADGPRAEGNEAASASTAPVASAAMDTGVAALLDLLGDTALPTAPEIPSSPVAEPEPAPSTVPPRRWASRLPRIARNPPGRTSWPGCVRASRRASSSSTTPRPWCIPSPVRPTSSAPACSSATRRSTFKSPRWPSRRSWRGGSGYRSASRSWDSTASSRAG